MFVFLLNGLLCVTFFRYFSRIYLPNSFFVHHLLDRISVTLNFSLIKPVTPPHHPLESFLPIPIRYELRNPQLTLVMGQCLPSLSDE